MPLSGRFTRRIAPLIILTAAGLCHPAAAAFPEPTTRPAASRPATTQAADALRVVTFNVRNSGAFDGENAWPQRRDLFVHMVRKLDPDLLGLQEVLADQQDDLTAALPDYASVYAGRNDGKRSGEGSPVFYRKGRFELIDHGTFWLSPTPEQIGVKGWDAALPRVCTWAVLRQTADGRTLLAASTHFDHIGAKAKTESGKLIAGRLTVLAAGRPVVLLGDLNSNDGTAAVASIGAAGFVDAYRQAHPEPSPDEATAHGFRGGTRARRIDYVFTLGPMTTTAAGIDRDRSKDGRFPSDHFPVWADVTWPKKDENR